MFSKGAAGVIGASGQHVAFKCCIMAPCQLQPCMACKLQVVMSCNHRPFAGLRQAGLDSLGAVELQNAVSRSLGVALPATVAFDYPTIAALTAFIATQQRPHPPGDVPAQQASFCSAELFPHALRMFCKSDTMTVAQVGDTRPPDAVDSLTYLVSTASRYPCAPDSLGSGLGSEGFWQPLQHGSDLPTVVPASRWDIDRCWLEPLAVLDRLSNSLADVVTTAALSQLNNHRLRHAHV